ncbi:MAG: gliding motility-associated C-terminal domain-containing protein, partial [Bacteroidia bacterium]|nr:gliding motility-associated C-terminal domain-containing protein [Bacteroidia bacterium]
FGDSTGKAWVELPTVGGPFGVKWLASTRINDTLYKQPAGEYLYTVTDSSTGCQITDTVTIYSPEVINGFFKVDTSKCLLNNGKILADISGGTGNYQLTWATNQGIPLNPINSKNPDNLSGGNYILTVVDAHNCIKKFTIEVPYTTPPTAQYLPASTEELVTDSIYAITDNSLSGTGTLTNWWWEIEGNTNNPIQTQNIDKYFFPDSGSYKIKLIVKNSAGCYDTISNIHKVKKHFFELYFPNIITPNGDGKNDMLTIKNLTQYPENQLLIYNRWGKKVFEKNNYQNDWDAKGMEDGTYYYIVKVPKQKDYEGFVSVIR